ncbi:hypothetical protein [Alkalihalobacterium elongatum]|uniref:hypothetical protein n=1 Tax=Alkalihalobacterium elongatum TaxID=2675466 RepID=UPI001C1F91ED|nr:hypothetical protein [Alkalihalobacterium elongatum]
MWYRFKKVSVILFVLLLSGCSSIDEREIVYHLNEIFTTASKLFQNHSPYGDLFYNEQFHTFEEVKRLLDSKVTEDGLFYMIDRIFDQDEEILVYKEPFQEYIHESNVYNSTINVSNSYYETVRETILNPGLRLIPEEELQFEEHGDTIIVTGENIFIEFYDIDNYSGSSHQYARYGYPANDVLSVTFTFIREDDGYLLDSFEIEDGEIVS